MLFSRMATAVLLVGAVLALGGCSSSSDNTNTAVDNFRIETFQADYTLGIDDERRARLDVRERIVADFYHEETNRGIVRVIPDALGDRPLYTHVHGVTDGAGAPVPYEVVHGDDAVTVLTGDDRFVEGITTYVLSYSQRDVVLPGTDGAPDEFYWNVNGTGWRQPFDDVIAVLRFDQALAGQLTDDRWCYAGDEYAVRECDIRTGTDGTVYARASGLLQGETLTVAIGLDPGSVVPGPDPRAAWWVVWLPIGLAVSAVGGIVLLGLLRPRRWPYAQGRGTVIAHYAPPEAVDLYDAADLVQHTERAFAAVIVDLAIRARIRIEDRGGRKGRYVLRLLGPSGVTPAESATLDALFGAGAEPGAQRTLGIADSSLREKLRTVLYAATDRAVAAGRRRRPATRLHPPLQWACVLVDLASVTLFVAAAIAGVVTAWIIVMFVTALVCLLALPVVCSRPARLTSDGELLREHLEGLALYVKLAEADRLRMLQSPAGADRGADDVVRVYERLLPFAVLWGMEKEWARVLVIHYEDADLVPEWLADVELDAEMLEIAMVGLGGLAQLAFVGAGAKAGAIATGLIGGAIGLGVAGGGGGGGGGGGR